MAVIRAIKKSGDIPDEWKIAELKEIVYINPESRDPTQTPLEKFFYIDIDAVENGSGVISTVKELIGKDAPSRARRVVHTDDVIMSEVRPYLKAFALVPKKLNNQICSTGFAVLRSKGEIDPQYLLNALFSNDVIDQCKRMMVGAQYPALNDSQVKKIYITLPPLHEQHRIATVLSKIDDAIQRSRQEISETEHLKTGMMQELMTKGIGHNEFKDSDIGKIPENWIFGKIIDFSKTKDEPVQTGPFGAQLHSSDYIEKGIPLILIKNVLGGKIIENDIPRISLKKAEELSRYRLKSGDIVFSRVGSVGRSAVIKEHHNGWLVSGQMLRVRMENPEISNDFLSYMIQTKWFQKSLESRIVGATRKSINTEILSNLPVVKPNLPEQHFISSILSTIDNKLDLQRQRTTLYERLKQGLMNELLTGKRRVKVT